MMTRHVDELMEEYCRGTLAPEQRQEIDAHVARCATCRTMMEEAALIFAAPTPSRNLDPRYVATILPRVRSQIAGETVGRRQRERSEMTRRVALPLSAAVIAGLIIASVVPVSHRRVGGIETPAMISQIGSDDVIEFIADPSGETDVERDLRASIALGDHVVLRSPGLPSTPEGLEVIQNQSDLYDVMAVMDDESVDGIIKGLQEGTSL